MVQGREGGGEGGITGILGREGRGKRVLECHIICIDRAATSLNECNPLLI